MKKLVVAAAAAVLALFLLWSSNTHRSTPPVDTVKAAHATRQLAPPTHDAGLDARPRGELRLEGQVVDNRDQPVAGVIVTLVEPRETATSADDGTFAFETLPAANYQLDAVSGEDRYAPVVSVTLSASSEPVILKLRPAASMLVRVSDAETHERLAGAAVSAWSQLLDAESAGRRSVTDSEGLAHLHGLGPGSLVRARVRGTGYESRELTLTVDVDPKVINEFAVSMHRGVAAGGTVRDASGAPVVDRIVSIDSVEGRSEATTDAKGVWHADALAAGRHLFYTWGDAKLEERVVELDGVHPKLDIDFALTAPRPREALRGITVDEAGRPVAGAKVVAHVYDPFGYDYQTSDSEGRFTANVFPGQDVSIYASVGEQRSDEIKVPAAARTQSVRLEMKRLVIEGQVRDRDGKPVADAEVVAGPSTFSDASGHFLLSGLSPQTYTLRAQRRGALPGGTAPSVTARPGDRDVIVIAPEIGVITGHVMLDGSPLTARLTEGSNTF